MAKFIDSLRGYAFPIHKRDQYVCQYCGLDGRTSFEAWLTLSLDHLLPKGHPERNNPEYTVTACQFCNTADNRYFDHAEKRGLMFLNLNREELITQRRPFVLRTRQSYHLFWEEHVSTESRE